ncbi:glyoxalase [Nocardioides sp. CER19]|uniref:glyoxalase n=1 Tax=Nocardioides sp. CER19 TaxID=3038538 RepID=UPI00244B2461|nr:glyoxalase [Nocardioides sp. CER19]MDH2413469.1 glyoxalase [Nocardioides sp. CER19]
MTTIDTITIEAPDPTAAEAFYKEAFDLGDLLRVRPAASPTSGFRGFTMSLVVAQPGNVDALVGAALEAGATTVKPTTKGFWGYGGVVQAPDGTIWKIATSTKKDTAPASRDVDQVVLLLGTADIVESKRFYLDRGLTVARSFGRKYVEFAAAPGGVTLALYGRKALAKDAGVPQDGEGSHRIAIVSDAGPFTDPDGFRWEDAAE